MYSRQTLIITTLAAAVVVACAIYLTPLKWLTFVEPSIHDIDPQEFYAAYQADPDKYVFIDVRPGDVYATLHAAGSQNMPLHMLYDTRHTLPKTGKEIVLICSGGRASGVGYSYLEHFGFYNISRIEGGIEKWVMEKLPTEGTAAP